MKRNEIAINFSVTHACFPIVFLKSTLLAAAKEKDCNPRNTNQKKKK